MRKVVITEGEKGEGQLYEIRPGALTCSRERIPITFHAEASLGSPIRGWASGFARDESTGEISFEFEMDPAFGFADVLEDLEPSIFVSPLEREREKDVVLKGDIRGITLISPSPAIPKDFLRKE